MMRMDFTASSLPGIGWDTVEGSEVVSTIPTHGIPARAASATAILWWFTSTTNIAACPQDIAPPVGDGTVNVDDLIAVVHMAVYLFYTRDPVVISSGAVWLDEPVQDRAEGVSRVQDLVLDTIDAARPAIRRHYRLAPVPN